MQLTIERRTPPMLRDFLIIRDLMLRGFSATYVSYLEGMVRREQLTEVPGNLPLDHMPGTAFAYNFYLKIYIIFIIREVSTA
jgi:hypothetical protein